MLGFEVRHRLLGRAITVIVMAGVWLVIVEHLAVTVGHHRPAGQALGMMWCFVVVAVVGSRALRASVTATRAGLVVHNVWATHRLPVEAITGFDTGPADIAHRRSYGHDTVYVCVLGGGMVPIDVLRTPAGAPEPLAGEVWRLQGWLAAARSATGPACC